MEYGDLVEFYKKKLLERYYDVRDQKERERLLERLKGADPETLEKITALLNSKKLT